MSSNSWGITSIDQKPRAISKLEKRVTWVQIPPSRPLFRAPDYAEPALDARLTPYCCFMIPSHWRERRIASALNTPGCRTTTASNARAHSARQCRQSDQAERLPVLLRHGRLEGQDGEAVRRARPRPPERSQERGGDGRCYNGVRSRRVSAFQDPCHASTGGSKTPPV